MNDITTFVISKGNLDNLGDARRYYDALALMYGVRYIHPDSTQLFVGRYNAMLRMPSDNGSLTLIKDKVLAKVDIQNGYSESDCKIIGQRIRDMMDKQGVPAKAMGTAAVRDLFNMMYLHYDEWSGADDDDILKEE